MRLFLAGVIKERKKNARLTITCQASPEPQHHMPLSHHLCVWQWWCFWGVGEEHLFLSQLQHLPYSAAAETVLDVTHRYRRAKHGGFGWHGGCVRHHHLHPT